MRVMPAELRSTHPYGFRPGTWAAVIGMVYVQPKGLAPLLCYAVRYGDGVVDYVAVAEEAHYEMRPVGGDEARRE